MQNLKKKKDTNELTYKTERVTDVENQHDYQRGRGREIN